MIKRRLFNQAILALATSAHSLPISAIATKHYNWHMPDESAPHKSTWMGFIANADIWPEDLAPQVEYELVRIAHAIAQYEPVNMLVRPFDQARSKRLIQEKHTRYPITLLPTKLDDLWLRDTGPTFVIDGKGNKAAIDFNFNGWGEKQHYHHDQYIAQFISQKAKAQQILSSLTLEGGCFEVDGHGTAIMTESCIINSNRNPGLSKGEIEKELKYLLGLKKIIWLKGIKGQDITDGHTDFYARFGPDNTVLVARENDPEHYDYQVTRENIRILQAASNAQGKRLKVVILDNPYDFTTDYSIENFAAGYIGYYLCNNAIIMQKFGDKTADLKAKQTLQKLFPKRTIEQMSIDAIASGGGTIHCATQQEPV